MADVTYIAEFMREADRAEIRSHSGREPLEALSFAFAECPRRWTIEVDGRPAAMFGVYRSGDIGQPWMLGTDLLVRAQWWFLRRSRKWLPVIAQGCDYLANVVDCRNTVHIRWIQWMGFRIVARVPEFGYELRPFLRFMWQKSV